MSENNNLPTLTGEASGTNIGVALQNLIANLHHNSGYDDVVRPACRRECEWQPSDLFFLQVLQTRR